MNFIYVVSGFTQKRYAKHGSGCVTIAADLLEYQSPETQVRLLEHGDDPKGYARYAADRVGTDGKIMVCAYSYGGGDWFPQFAAELARLGVSVDVAVLCDPVYRRPWYLRFMQWRAITSWWQQKLKLTGNIKRVVHFIQFKNEPGGDTLILHGDVEYVGPTDLDQPHVKMDNTPQFRAACVNEAARLFS